MTVAAAVVATHLSTHSLADAGAKAAEVAAAVAAGGAVAVANLRAGHERWWAAYWATGWVAFPSSHLVETMWYQNLYILAIAAGDRGPLCCHALLQALLPPSRQSVGAQLRLTSRARCPAGGPGSTAGPGLYGPFVTADQMDWAGDLTLNYNAEATFYVRAASLCSLLVQAGSAPQPCSSAVAMAF